LDAEFASLRPLLPFICSANSAPPVFASFAGASTLARALVLSARLVLQSAKGATTLVLSDALAEASITRAPLKPASVSGPAYSVAGVIGAPIDADAIAGADDIAKERAVTKATSATLQRLEKIQAKFGVAKK
jgi:hypothetical protein